MKRNIITLFTLTVFYNTACAQQSDFDKVCGYFNNLQTVLTERSMTNSDKAAYIKNFINKNLKSDSPAKEAFELVLHATAEHRYELYRTSAQEVTKTKWECKTMEKLLPETGEF